MSITRLAACRPGTRYPFCLTQFLLLLLLGFQRSDRVGVGVGVGRKANISLRIENLQHVGSDSGNDTVNRPAVNQL